MRNATEMLENKKFFWQIAERIRGLRQSAKKGKETGYFDDVLY